MSYCGHMAICDGVITIDLGGRVLSDGIYSIIQESKPSKKEKPRFNPSYGPYNRETFADEVVKAIDGREISIKALAREMGMHESTLARRVKNSGVIHLFKLRKSASEY